jgi:WD40 repeat protein/predicted  nucleic acid-binding Zn-ribbon protein
LSSILKLNPMPRKMIFRTPIFAAALLGVTASVFGADKINYQDHALPIFRNSCLGCHNPDKKKGGLDLSSWKSAMAGGSDGVVINPGDPDGSLLYRCVTHTDEPNMPPKGDKLPDAQLNVLKAWILAGALPTASGKPAVSAKPKIDLSFKAPAAGHRPAGPPPMPEGLPLEPFVHARRAGALSALASSPWAPLVALAGQHEVLLYNSQTLALLGVLPYPDGQPQVLRFSAGGNLLLAGGGEGAKSGKVVLWDVASGNHIADIGEEFDAVLAADITPDLSRVALGGPAKLLKIYSTKDGSLIDSIKTHTDWVTAVAYSPDGVLLASGDRAGGLWVWESKTNREFYNLAGHKAAVTSVAFRADSNLLASASEDGTIKLWDMNSGREAKSWQAHAGGVLSVSFGGDGRIVSCGRDRVVRVWNADGSSLKQLDAFNDIALKAVFDSDGSRVIAGDFTGEVRVWTTADGKRAGALDPNPGSLADQIAAVTQRIAELQPAAEKSSAELATARADHDKEATELQSAQKALTAAHQHVKDGQSQVAALVAREHSAADAEAAAREMVKSTEAEAPTTAPADSTALDDSRRALADIEKSHAEIIDQLHAAQAALVKAQGEGPPIDSQILALRDQVRSANLHLQIYSAAAGTSAKQLAAARGQLAGLKAGQFFATVAVARKQLAQCQQQQEQCAQGLAAAQANVDKANANLAAAQKALSDAPARIQARQDAIAQAQIAAAAAQQNVAAAQDLMTQKQTLLSDASALAQRIQDADAKAADGKLLDALGADIAAAKQAVAARISDVAAANDRVTAAQGDLAHEQADIAAAPKTMDGLQAAVAAAEGELPAKQSALDQASRACESAKSKADQLTGVYQKMTEEAGLTPAGKT